MIFWRRKQLVRNVLVLDIAADSTSAAVVKTTHESIPEILAKVRTPFTLENKSKGVIMEKAMISSLRETLNRISKKLSALMNNGLRGHMDKVVITLSAPWSESNMKTVVVAKDSEFIFNSDMLRILLKEEEKTFSNSLKESYKEESEVFEVALTSLYLNGYETPSPVKEKIKRVEVTFMISATTKELLEKIENELIKSVGIKNGIVVHSFMFTLYKVLSHSYHNLHTALLLSVTSETTDVLLMRHGSSAVSDSIPFGSATIAESLAKKLNIPKEIALSYLSLYGERFLDTETSANVEETIAMQAEIWKKEWSKNGLDPESADEPFYSIFLVTPDSGSKLMKTFFDKVFPKRNVILIGDTNNFTKQLVKDSSDKVSDEKMFILASFSNLLK